MGKKVLVIRILAVLLIVFGVSGAIGSFVAIQFMNKANIDTALGLSMPVQEEFKSMSRTMGDASITTNNAAYSLRNAKGSLSTGSEIATNVAGKMYDLSPIFGITLPVLNYCPFCSASDYFTRTGNQFSSLSFSLSNTANSLENNAQDMERLSRDFTDMAAKLDAVSGKFNQNVNLFPVWRLRQITTYVLLYIALLHLMFLFTGLALLLLTKNKKLDL